MPSRPPASAPEGAPAPASLPEGFSTKDRIVVESLRLFARKGFAGVSVRDIAEAVGIKPASLYKHFASKQAIFDGVIAFMDARYASLAHQVALPRGAVGQEAAAYGAISTDALADLARALFTYATCDEFAVLYRRMLTIGQFGDPVVARLHQSANLEAAVEHQGALFACMIERGILAPADPHVLALEFYGPIYLLICQHDVNPSPRLLDDALAHVAQFARVHTAAPARA